MGIEQLPKIKVGEIKYFLDVRLNEARRVDIPFMSLSLDDIELSEDKVNLVSLRTDLETKETCLNTKELDILNRFNLDKKSREKLKNASACWVR